MSNLVSTLQELMDLAFKDDPYKTRYILHYYTQATPGFGGFATGIMEVYMRYTDKSVMLKRFEAKGKIELIEKELCANVLKWISEGNINCE